MRSTIDLPEELMRAAKAMAAEHGEPLKALFARAVAHEVRFHARPRSGKRVVLPLVGGNGPAVDVTNADIEAALAAEDADRYRWRRRQ